MMRRATRILRTAMVCLALETQAHAQAAVPPPQPAPGTTPPPHDPSYRSAAPAPAGTRPQAEHAVALLATRGLDVDPDAVTTVDSAVADAAVSRGLAPSPEADRVLPSFGVAYPRAPADVWYVTRTVGANYGIYATVRSEAGEYVVHVTVADARGTGPFLHEERADADGLYDTARRAVAHALDRAGVPVPPATPRPAQAREEAEPTFRLLRLAFGTRAAFGLTDRWFYNHLAGAFIDRRFSPDLSVGVGAHYANLKGPEGRAHNALFEARLDYRVDLYADTLELPLRLNVGYLPRNGPTLQPSAGLSLRPGQRVDIVLDLLAPMLWVSEDLTVTSLNVGLEVGIDF